MCVWLTQNAPPANKMWFYLVFSHSQYFQHNPHLAETSKRMKSQIWSAVVPIVLIEARNLPNDTENNVCEPYIRFRLGNENYKSKASWKSQWLKQFDLHLFEEEQTLEVIIWNRSTQYGRCLIDLRSLPREETQRFWQKKKVDHSTIRIYLMFTISDLTSFKPDEREQIALKRRYNFFENITKSP